MSVLPHVSKDPPIGPTLIGPNGGKIKTWGYKTHTVKLGHRSFTFDFILADVQKPILGINFLASHALLVDPARLRVLDSRTLSEIGPPGRGGQNHSDLVAAIATVPGEIRALIEIGRAHV